MKNKFLYTLLALLPIFLYSCKDDEVITNEDGTIPDREFMTMFRKDHNTGKGDDEPYACKVVDLNDIQLYWYGVKDCAGYQIRMALQANVSSGLAEDWDNPAHLLMDTIVGPDVLDLLVKDLEYSTSYRFAIRTLSPKGEGYHSKWYGYGDGRHWADWFGLDTDLRYNTPDLVVIGNITKTSFRLNLDLSYATSGDPGDYKQHFEVDEDGNFVVHIISVLPSPTNPSPQVPDKWKKYEVTAEDKAKGYIDIDGLDMNSVYVVNAENKNIPIHVDAVYNTCTVRTDGEPGEPIFLEHSVNPDDTIPGAVKYQAMCLDKILEDYTADNTLTEGTIFELEGGKIYYFANNPSLCKGMTMRTRQSDLDAGKGNAKIYLNGMSKNPDGSGVSCNFMFGRQPQSGESDAPINVKSVIFEDIDFDSPEATNYGDGKATGNYFANMYSNGMAVTFNSFEVRRCTFQHMVRGFIRVQGTKRKVFEKILVEDCLFYNNGYYDNNGAGYAWIAGDGKDPKSNIFKDMIFRGNTFYDSPRTALFSDNNKTLAWPPSVQYKITLENNTFVNFSTRSSGRYIFSLRYLPGGSQIVVKKNLFIQTKAVDDDRNLNFNGMDIRSLEGTGPKEITFDIADNYAVTCEESKRKDDGIFTGGAFSAKKNSAGAFLDYLPGVINGAEQLTVKVGSTPLAPTDLMVDPNPPYKNGDKDMHETTTEKLMNGLRFKNTDQVRNHEIYKLGIGDPRWRQ